MTTTQPNNLHVIGLTGSFGSGCTYVAENVLGKVGYERVSLSALLRREYESSGAGSPNDVPREELQAYGDTLRKEFGSDYLATLAHKEIKRIRPSDQVTRVVVDSIRNPAEIHFLRGKYPSGFFLFGVYASSEQRWERVRKNVQYHGDRRKFDDDDQRDSGRSSEKWGQRVEDCFVEADVVFSNDIKITTVGNEPFQAFSGKVKGYLELVESPLSRRQPTPRESLMAAAYTISQRSSCMQRKVGAVIVDDEGNIVSSGFNEVPRESRPCVHEYGECRRKVIWQEVSEHLQERFPDLDSNRRNEVAEFLRGELRILGSCRSLHAEENAIVNLAKNGRSMPLERCTLYTTTYPCRLCANKIVNLGLGHVVYLEPYPDPEAKVVLSAGNKVKDEFFEGITFKAYARVYGEKK
jgi:deoxycytidylate deaminase/dephospho-CoA kinase